VNGWLLDTNIVSELRRPKPEKRVIAFLDAQSLEQLFVSCVTYAEIRFGIEVIADASKRSELGDWLKHTIRPLFVARVLNVNEGVMLRWRLMVEEGKKTRRTFSQPDLLIAATAAVHDLTVVTRNTSDFEVAGVAVFNPWKQTLP
jgi:toxin FitB